VWFGYLPIGLQDAKVSAWLREVMQQHMVRDNNLGFNQAEEDRFFIKSQQVSLGALGTQKNE
jgi:hypothetical protein